MASKDYQKAALFLLYIRGRAQHVYSLPLLLYGLHRVCCSDAYNLRRDFVITQIVIRGVSTTMCSLTSSVLHHDALLLVTRRRGDEPTHLIRDP